MNNNFKMGNPQLAVGIIDLFSRRAVSPASSGTDSCQVDSFDFIGFFPVMSIVIRDLRLLSVLEKIRLDNSVIFFRSPHRISF